MGCFEEAGSTCSSCSEAGCVLTTDRPAWCPPAVGLQCVEGAWKVHGRCMEGA